MLQQDLAYTGAPSDGDASKLKPRSREDLTRVNRKPERRGCTKQWNRPDVDLDQVTGLLALRLMGIGNSALPRERNMYKDIVIPITGNPGDSYALNMALDLASSHEAHLTVMEMVNLPMPGTVPWGLMPDPSTSEIYGQLREQGQANVAKLKQRLEKEITSSEVRLVEAFFSEPSQLAAHYAHYADLTVIAGSMGDSREGDILRSYFGSLLIDSGRPVLVIPQGCKGPMPPKRIVVAWRPTGECARAVHDALPLLVTAESVELIVVDPVGGERGHGEQPGADIAAHIARHGANVNVQVRQSHGNRIASVLLEHARETHANMLVVGGYGHSRIREWALGGVTRELLFEASIPVFYSH